MSTLPVFRLASAIALSLVGVLGVASAQEGVSPPREHPLCRQATPDKAVKRESVFTTWPDGSVKSKAMYYADGTSLQLHFHANGQMQSETHQAKVLIDGNPRHRKTVTQGTEKRWHDNGQLFVCAVYEDGNKTGTWIYHGEDGQPQAAFRYENDKEVAHLTYSPVFGWQPFAR